LTAPALTETYTLSLHDALPILRPQNGDTTSTAPSQMFPAASGGPASSPGAPSCCWCWASHWSVSRSMISPIRACGCVAVPDDTRSEEHTSELQSRFDLVCRLLL